MNGCATQNITKIETLKHQNIEISKYQNIKTSKTNIKTLKYWKTKSLEHENRRKKIKTLKIETLKHWNIKT